MRVARLSATAVTLVSIAAGACGRSPVAPTGPPTVAVTRFLAFGDSMTEGTVSPALTSALTAGLPVSYPYKLQERLTATYLAQTLEVSNAGRAGERADQGVRRLPGVMSEVQPHVLLLLEGVNDLNSRAGIAPTIEAVASMIQYARAQGVFVLVATLPPQRRGGQRASSVDLVPGFNDELRKMAAGEGATLVDVNSAFDLIWIGQDGLHPTDAGYSRLADIFFAAIRRAFEQPGQAGSRILTLQASPVPRF